MALFKPMLGSRASLDAQEKHAGYAYFCIDDGTFHIDYVDAEGNLQRKQINAKAAEALIGCDITPEKIALWDASVFYIQDTAPTNASVGAIWIDTSVASTTNAEDVSF